MYTIEKDNTLKKFVLWEQHKSCKVMMCQGTRGYCKSYLQKCCLDNNKNAKIVEVRNESNCVKHHTNRQTNK